MLLWTRKQDKWPSLKKASATRTSSCGRCLTKTSSTQGSRRSIRCWKDKCEHIDQKWNNAHILYWLIKIEARREAEEETSTLATIVVSVDCLAFFSRSITCTIQRVWLYDSLRDHKAKGNRQTSDAKDKHNNCGLPENETVNLCPEQIKFLHFRMTSCITCSLELYHASDLCVSEFLNV